MGSFGLLEVSIIFIFLLSWGAIIAGIFFIIRKYKRRF